MKKYTSTFLSKKVVDTGSGRARSMSATQDIDEDGALELRKRRAEDHMLLQYGRFYFGLTGEIYGYFLKERKKNYAVKCV